ncbi:hypothetical protein RYA99_04670 [Pseudomonas syringae pv. actinidifoliorum]|nr:hypothetical protein [Pseudomonas syringae pv. actinidifoliorum]MDU8519397.1 hypothetical protein [Pseudomonas syringae pv. actinidifoliorum]MDU8525463.1 hypothetical protein [Pseudomonas syringae pv. actinidifoliorum]
MKLVVAQLLAVVVAICLFEVGKSDSDLAFSKAGLVALALSFALMVAGLAVEFFEWRREGSQAL